MEIRKLSALAGGVFLFMPMHQAEAKLEICNETEATRSVAIAYSKQKKWTSEGWWVIKPGNCKTVVSGGLKQRYYYYHASRAGAKFKGHGYYFCAKSKPFTIVGEKSCDNRGYQKRNFRKIDTGTKSKSFKLTLTGSAPKPKISAPGTHGEPATITGQFKGCLIKYGSEYCEILTNEWVYVVAKDDRTPASIYNKLKNTPIGRTVTIEGDISGYGDVSVDIVARRITVSAEVKNSFAALHTKLRGGWKSVDDSLSTIRFENGDYYSYYEGNLTDKGNYSLKDACSQGGQSIKIKLDSDPEAYCYVIESMSNDRLELMYLPRGNILTYQRDSP